MLLASPVHSLLSGSLVVLTYTGRKSGQRHSLPVMYAERDGKLIVFAGRSRDKRWWRNFRIVTPVKIILRGRRLQGWAQAILDDAVAIEAAEAAYTAKFPKATAAVTREKAVCVRIAFRKEEQNSS